MTPGKRVDSQVTLNPNHCKKRGLKGSIGRAPIFLVFVAELPFIERRRRVKKDVHKVPELSLRLRHRGGGLPFVPRGGHGQPDSRKVILPTDESG